MTTTTRTVSDIMTRDVYTLNEDDNLAYLLESMKLLRFRHTPVTDGDRLVGLLTQRDLLRISASSLLPAAREQDALLQRTFHVRDVMVRDVIAVPPDLSLPGAAQLLFSNKIGCLPVVDPQNKLLGIVTEHDLAKLALSLLPAG
jgi:CBS domain-containing membrane protein